MDPATIGLLISIAPTVLDILFGRGNAIKQETFPKKMYGYGLEGYGYRYPPPSEKFVLLPLETKHGIIQKAIPVPTKKWVAAYYLNKKSVENNPWVKFMRTKMGALRNEYYTTIKKEKEAPPVPERIRHKLMLEAIKRSPELAAIKDLNEDELLKLYYEGRVPLKRRIKKEELPVLELPKK
jgi:hypothetical protein